MITNDDINNSIERAFERFMKEDRCELFIQDDGSVEIIDNIETVYYVQADGTVNNYDIAAWDALQWERASAENAETTEKEKYYNELCDKILYHENDYKIDLKNILKLAIENDKAITHVSDITHVLDEKNRMVCEFSIGVTEAYGHMNEGNMNAGKEIIKKLLPDSIIKNGLAIYPRDFGCPNGGENVLVVHTLVENKDIAIAEIRTLMDCLKQSTVTAEFPGINEAVYLSEKGNKINNFELDKFKLVFREGGNTSEILQEATEMQLANQGIISTGVYVGNEGIYSGVRNPEFCKESELYHHAAIDFYNMVENEMNRRNNSVELD